MIELVIKSKGGKDITTSLIVAEIFGKSHDKVCRDIEALYCSPEFRAANFGDSSFVSLQNKVLPMYQMTKDGFSFLVMGYTGPKSGEFKEKFIAEFNKREALLRDEDYIVARSNEILNRRLNTATKRINELETKVANDSSKVLFAETVGASKHSILVKELAAYLTQGGYRIGQNKLFAKLRAEGYLCKGGSYYNLPTQMALNLGLFEVKKSTITQPETIIASTTTKVTGKGQVYFLNKFLKSATQSVAA